MLNEKGIGVCVCVCGGGGSLDGSSMNTKYSTYRQGSREYPDVLGSQPTWQVKRESYHSGFLYSTDLTTQES